MLKEALRKTYANFKIAIPMILGILLLINLLNPLFQKFYPLFFTGNYLIDSFIGALLGSIAFGMPLTAYIAGGELLQSGISLIAVTAFILTWTTVGLAMIPLELKFLGKKFAIYRNLMNFFLGILISILVILTLKLFN